MLRIGVVLLGICFIGAAMQVRAADRVAVESVTIKPRENLDDYRFEEKYWKQSYFCVWWFSVD